MNTFKLTVAAIAHRPLPHLLQTLLMAFATALIVMMMLVADQLQTRAERDAGAVDLVLGAHGSPLQLVLSTVYHLDVPTGNIPLTAVERWAAHPMVAEAVPMALGDSAGGFRIVGTTPAYSALYDATLAEGRWAAAAMEAVVGAEVAMAGLRPGRTFNGTHGLGEGGHQHDAAPYRVVGVLAPSGTVLDRLILTGLDSVWALHADASDDESADDHHEHEHEHEHEHNARTVTAALLRFQTPFAAAVLPREIADEGGLLSARPAQELMRLRVLAQGPLDALKGLAVALIVLAALAMLAALNGALEGRRYDLALMRALGVTRWRLVRLLWLEAVLLALTGVLMGLALGHLGAEWIGRGLPGRAVTGWAWVSREALLLPLALGVASLAVVLPGWRAFRVEVATTLSRN